MKKYNVAVVGATGAVGTAMIRILAQRGFPVQQLYPLASARSAGNTIDWQGNSQEIYNLADFDFANVDIALFSAGGDISKEHAPRASEHAIVIDNTSHFRYEKDIPLIVPEVNPEQLDMVANKGIIANPNCSTIQLLLALHPVQQAVGIDRINIATYQAVSGSGTSGLAEMDKQLQAYVAGKTLDNTHAKQYSQPIALNVLPQIDVFLDNGYTKEEMKIVWETRKIFADESIRVNATCVRVPVAYGHSEAVHIETRSAISVEQVRALLDKAEGVALIDDISRQTYPTALMHAAGRDAVYVGRIRKDISCDNGINMWVVSDNLRKGAALNSIQIAELLIARGMV